MTTIDYEKLIVRIGEECSDFYGGYGEWHVSGDELRCDSHLDDPLGDDKPTWVIGPARITDDVPRYRVIMTHKDAILSRRGAINIEGIVRTMISLAAAHIAMTQAADVLRTYPRPTVVDCYPDIRINIAVQDSADHAAGLVGHVLDASYPRFKKRT